MNVGQAVENEKLIKNKIANVLHFYRNCKDSDAEIENSVNLLFELKVNVTKDTRISELEKEVKEIEDLPYQIKGVGELQIYRDENGWIVGYDKECVTFASSGKTLSEAVGKLKGYYPKAFLAEVRGLG
ncbi:MAG TPA: hypothetical protein ENH82_00805 [bacterium]|nr:hypothetical protein [bacterium]